MTLRVENIVPCSCHTFGTTVPSAWHSCANELAQLCQRRGTSIKKAASEKETASFFVLLPINEK
ncbi:hypothetical protein NXX42_03290 [Bacteroides thetaiotaomicron]|nr:hypothetical protein [Bacteroides thetaiotaomicron]